MYITKTTFNAFKEAVLKGEVNCLTDTFKVRLMGTSYTLDQSTQSGWSDVSSYEISAANGYPSGGYTLPTPTITRDNTNNRAEVFWSGEVVTIIASGGSIANIQGVIVYDDTHSSDCLVGYALFSETVTVTDGSTAKLANIYFRLA